MHKAVGRGSGRINPPALRLNTNCSSELKLAAHKAPARPPLPAIRTKPRRRRPRPGSPRRCAKQVAKDRLTRHRQRL
jgi:hypothetical protein